jgi:DNA-binding NarL/FixJ family response regulator
MPITIALIEDNAEVRESMLKILAVPGCKCVGAFPSGEEALIAIPKLEPKVVLMDIGLKGMDGVECVRQLAKIMELPQILMLTVHEDPDSILIRSQRAPQGTCSNRCARHNCWRP